MVGKNSYGDKTFDEYEKYYLSANNLKMSLKFVNKTFILKWITYRVRLA